MFFSVADTRRDSFHVSQGIVCSAGGAGQLPKGLELVGVDKWAPELQAAQLANHTGFLWATHYTGLTKHFNHHFVGKGSNGRIIE